MHGRRQLIMNRAQSNLSPLRKMCARLAERLFLLSNATRTFDDQIKRGERA